MKAGETEKSRIWIEASAVNPCRHDTGKKCVWRWVASVRMNHLDAPVA